MAASLTAAAKRAMALNEWLKNKHDGKSAASPYSSSISNFVTNQKEQFAYYSIKAALELAQLIGSLLSSTGLCAAVGEPLQKAAALAETTVDKLKEFYDQAEMEKAWATTKQALDNPNNRRLGLIARSLNPTLAKYSLAWGAYEKKDPIAKSALASCGLNAATLADKDSNVDNVVKFLEVKFSDDRQVKKALPKKPKWQPADIKLDIKCWAATRTAGEKQGDLKKQATGAIDGALAHTAKLAAEIAALPAKPSADDKKKHLELLTAHETQLATLRVAFEAYKPVRAANNTPHEEMAVIVDTFVGLVEVEQGEIKTKRASASKVKESE
jgi:hypothetical protein